MLSPEHCVLGGGGWGVGGISSWRGRGSPLPRFLIHQPVHTFLTTRRPHPYSWTPGPCAPMGLWLQTLHHAQGQLRAWQPEATDPDIVLVITVSPLPSAEPLLRPLSTMVVPLFPASPITFLDPTFQSQLLLNSKGTGTGPPWGKQVAWKCQSRKEGGQEVWPSRALLCLVHTKTQGTDLCQGG